MREAGILVDEARRRSFVVAAIAVISTLTACTEKKEQAPAMRTGSVASLLPVGRVTADVMEIMGPPRHAQLAARMQESVQRDPGFWKAQVRASSPGVPLPYDARMGVTEPEYREFLALSDSMRIRPVAQAAITIESIPNGWRIDGGETLPDMRGIEIDTVAGELRTPMGEVGNTKQIVGSPRQKATGPWDGIEWLREDESVMAGEGSAISFSLGRLAESGRVLLYYNAKKVSGGQLTARAMRILTFDAPR